jgi:thiamine-phosphate pyrophosphorylase
VPERQPALLPRLYAILDIDTLDERGLDPDDVLEAWLDAGVTLVQLRAKRLPTGPFLALAEVVTARARRSGARVLVNDRADVAAWSGAAGVHVGAGDLSPREVRTMLPAGALVGVSTHAPAETAEALRGPVDYVAIGAVYATKRKPAGHPVVGLAGVAEAAALAASAGVPLVAIGGLTRARAADVLSAGAATLAVIGDLVDGDPGTCAREWLAILEAATPGTPRTPPV